jgi:antitoxin component YwqK of YwqJK toxin-antitoxin module
MRVLALRIDEINASFPKKSGQAMAFYDNGRPRHTGRMSEGVRTGKWQWFRRDGTLERTGGFRNGVPAGEWLTYDAAGAVVERIRH